MKNYFQVLKTSKRYRYVTALSFILWVAFLVLSQLYSTIELDKLQSHELRELRSHYDMEFSHYNSYVYLVEAIIVEQDGDFNQEEFVGLLETLDHGDFEYLSISETSVVEYVYPESHLHLHGDDLTQSLNTAQYSELIDSINTNNLVYQYETSYNVDKIYIRKAVTVNDEFYGFITLCISASSFEASTINFESDYLDAGLFTGNGDLIIGEGEIEDYEVQRVNFGDSYLYVGGKVNEQSTFDIIIQYYSYFITISLILIVLNYYTFVFVTENDKLLKELDYRQNYDSETSLYNVERLYKDILSLVDKKTKFFLVFVNITNLKYISGKFGYYLTSDLLKKTTSLIDRVLRENATFYRHGGDEYVITVKTDSQSEVSNLLRRISKIFDNDISIGNIRARLGLTVGITSYPDHGTSPEELIKNAHLASQQVSSYDKEVFKFYEPDKIKSMITTEGFDIMIKDLNLELFEVYLMPIVDVQTNCIVGFECLTRAFDDFGGKLPTEEVVLSLERNGRIQELDEIVFKKMLINMKRINKEFPDQDFFLSLNASALSVNDEYVENIISYYKNARLKKGQIVLELTESYRVEDYDYLIRLFNKLIENGIKVAIDDFGSGYSSISYIAKFPIYAIKVDKQYVKDYDTNKFNRTLLITLKSIADTLGCKLVAEGVDNHETLDYLKEVGCPSYQGYLFSKGVPLDDAIALIKNNLCKKE